MSAPWIGLPSLAIVFEYERPVRLVCDALDEGERARLDDWLASHDAYLRVIAAAAELSCAGTIA